MKRIPVLDLSYEISELKPQLMDAFASVLDNGAFIMGPNVKSFENEVAEYLGVKHAIALNSGTDALVIALLAAGIGEGDEVITTPFTFFATAEAISQVRATPVFVDVEPQSYNMDLDQLEAAITPRTKAIIPVHLFGHAVEMTRLMEIADRRGLLVVEDVAQAFGADCEGRKVGTIGHLGCYSFFPTKNLGAYGDGGLLVTNDSAFAEKASMLRVHGSKKKYYNELIGFNSRLDELQAAILRIKLPRIDEWNAGRRKAAATYKELLGSVGEIVLPIEAPYAKHVFHQYTIRILNGKRQALQEKLEAAGVSTMVYYPVPVHKLPIYQALEVTMPTAESLAEEVISLPIWPQIEPAIQAYVANKIIEALQ
ncbi:DegT/DnrJ/EryC1/StrS family aminotransferase [Paenibacillus glycinis]|uniref:Aminotransferase class V-fold PLP-dependent enzyme n=1 Tax=Paenibacillus glycinis TaxID=2697035 RepID=A0ABW9XPA4_9BACL|nr:DegT/DnrJ/EryC1/StrS family aminotransferase [Paenibacillus glycinis]NBD24207.1 aminotransferase class V-fold PLP-dependent enzyme [Paenibacillus glycinis]